MTVTRYAVTWKTQRGTHTALYDSEADARAFAARLGERLVEVAVASSPVEVGTKVKVQAYGRGRPGVVTGLGRTRVEVEFTRNAQGEKDVRKFRPSEVLWVEGETRVY